jgi:hypothetical protein
MARQYDFRPARALRIHCPVAEPVLARLLAGDRQALEDDPALAAMLAIVRGDNPLGDFGLYRGVMELARLGAVHADGHCPPHGRHRR